MLNRFGKDVETIDSSLAGSLQAVNSSLAGFFASIIVVAYVPLIRHVLEETNQRNTAPQTVLSSLTSSFQQFSLALPIVNWLSDT